MKIPGDDETVFVARFVAEDSNTTYRPFALRYGESLGPLANEPSAAMETSEVAGTQPVGAPAHVSRTKISPWPLDPPAIKLSAVEANET